MRGLREKESQGFEKYFDLIQDEAWKKDCVFFMDGKEGRPFSNGEMEGENLSGWLVPKKKARAFEKDYLAEEIDLEWDSAYHFALWSEKDGKISVRFLHYTTVPHEHDNEGE